jgi:hypothetical protein
MIKVFTSGNNAYPSKRDGVIVEVSAGEDLTVQFDEWFADRDLEIINFHTNSNKYGWSLTVHYKENI